MAGKHGVFGEWSRRYLVEYLIALFICVAAARFSIPLARETAGRGMRILLMSGPTAGILLMAFVIFRHYLRVDEFLRRVMMESFAVAGAVASVWTLAYALCELAGFPKISMWWVWGSLAVAWNAWIFGRWAFRR